MKKRILSLFAAVAVMLSLSACQPNDTGQDTQPSEVIEQTNEITEMKTIEPPEDGWTLEELNTVMYLNQKPFSLPCTADEITDYFEIQNNYLNQKDNNSLILDVLYDGKYAFSVKGIQDNVLMITEISIPALGYEANIPRDELFVINGFKLTGSLDELEAALGKPTSYSTTRYVYVTIDQKQEIGFMFSSDKTVNSMYITSLEE